MLQWRLWSYAIEGSSVLPIGANKTNLETLPVMTLVLKETELGKCTVNGR